FFQIVDRKDNMIISGGENIYPSEIEEVVGSQECVFDCAVIIPKDTVESEVTERMIMDCCREQMAGYKRPKKIVFIKEDEMPRTPTGKILHRKLRAKFSEMAKKI
ncbi:MAG: long-chain fatty acid--CoA ligase, partial [Deltaproteobacteria bacterium]|nr:long-chain fatty acid--CoA ligase [Deltaproteobacteria bacterium]